MQDSQTTAETEPTPAAPPARYPLDGKYMTFSRWETNDVVTVDVTKVVFVSAASKPDAENNRRVEVSLNNGTWLVLREYDDFYIGEEIAKRNERLARCEREQDANRLNGLTAAVDLARDILNARTLEARQRSGRDQSGAGSDDAATESL